MTTSTNTTNQQHRPHHNPRLPRQPTANPVHLILPPTNRLRSVKDHLTTGGMTQKQPSVSTSVEQRNREKTLERNLERTSATITLERNKQHSSSKVVTTKLGHYPTARPDDVVKLTSGTRPICPQHRGYGSQDGGHRSANTGGGSTNTLRGFQQVVVGGDTPTPPPEPPWILDAEMQFHIRHCPCNCDHLGFGNYLDYQVVDGVKRCTHRETSFNDAGVGHHGLGCQVNRRSVAKDTGRIENGMATSHSRHKLHHRLQQQEQMQNNLATSAHHLHYTTPHHDPPNLNPITPDHKSHLSSQTTTTTGGNKPLPKVASTTSLTNQHMLNQQPVSSNVNLHQNFLLRQNGYLGNDSRSYTDLSGQRSSRPRDGAALSSSSNRMYRDGVSSGSNRTYRDGVSSAFGGSSGSLLLRNEPSVVLPARDGFRASSTTFGPSSYYYDDYQLTPLDSCSCSSDGSDGMSTGSGRETIVRGPWCICLVVCIVVATLAAGLGLPLALNPQQQLDSVGRGTAEERMIVIRRLLKDAPLIDGHNDLPWNIRKFTHNRITHLNLSSIHTQTPWSSSRWSHTDIPRLRAGLLGAQFWSAYVPCKSQHLDAVQLTLEQIDVIRRLVELNSQHLALVESVGEIREVHRNGRIASLIGVEGGHALGNSLAVLRTFYNLGARYLTITHSCDTPWAQGAITTPTSHSPSSLLTTTTTTTPLPTPTTSPLTPFGQSVIHEMNRLGMMIDLSHTTAHTARAVLNVTQAPVIFSHSSAYSLCNSARNVPDDVLKLVAHNGGVVMVNFYARLVSCGESASLGDVVRHINHIRAVAGVEHVGLGAGYDGVNVTPSGLEDVSRYPHLLVELLADPQWSPQDIALLAGQNLLRVFSQVELIRDAWKRAAVQPGEERAPAPPPPLSNCRSIYS